MEPLDKLLEAIKEIPDINLFTKIIDCLCEYINARPLKHLPNRGN